MLSGTPCCNDNDCNNQFLSTKIQKGKQTSNEKQCPGCSPFFTCGSCVGFIISKPLTITFSVIAEVQIQKFIPYSQPAIQKISLAIWLPPKLS